MCFILSFISDTIILERGVFMYKISNFTDNNDVKVIEELGPLK